MNCPFCQSTLPNGSAFCSQCGQQLPETAPSELNPSPEVAVPSITADEVTAAAAPEGIAPEAVHPAPIPSATPPTAFKPTKKKKRPLWRRIICGFFSAILLTLAIVLGIALGAILMIQNITSPETIRLMISEIDFTEMEITIDGESQTVSDAVHEAFANAQAENGNPDEAIDPERIDMLLEADFVRDFMADTASGMTEDLLNDTSESDMTSDDIRVFITDNRTDIEEILEVEVTDEMIDGIAVDLEESQVLEKMSVKSITDNTPSIMSILSLVTSTVAWILFGILLFILALIALINWFRPIALSYAGIAFLAVGGLYGALAVLIRSGVGWMADSLDISISILNFIVSGVVNAATEVFIIGAVIGILLIAAAIAYTIIRHTLRKKAQ